MRLHLDKNLRIPGLAAAFIFSVAMLQSVSLGHMAGDIGFEVLRPERGATVRSTPTIVHLENGRDVVMELSVRPMHSAAPDPTGFFAAVEDAGWLRYVEQAFAG